MLDGKLGMEYTPFGSKSGVSHLGTNLVRSIWDPILGALIWEQICVASDGASQTAYRWGATD